MTLVEAPVLDNGEPLSVHLGKHVVEGVDSTLEVGGIAQVKVKACLFEGTAALLSLFNAVLGQLNICPASELVFLVPFAFAMADKYQFHNKHSFRWIKITLTSYTIPQDFARGF